MTNTSVPGRRIPIAHRKGWPTQSFPMPHGLLKGRERERRLASLARDRTTLAEYGPGAEVTVDSVGGIRTLPADQMRNFSVIDLQDVRRSAGVHKASNVTGVFPITSAQGSYQIRFDSLAERRHWMRILHQEDWGDLAAQPMLLTWQLGDLTINHYPDILVDVGGNGRLLADVHDPPYDAATTVKFLLTSFWARSLGWTYEVWKPVDRQYAKNLEHIWMFRNVQSAVGNAAESLLAETSWPMTVSRIRNFGHFRPMINLAGLFHLVWHRRLHLDLQQPIRLHSAVTPLATAQASPWRVTLRELGNG